MNKITPQMLDRPIICPVLVGRTANLAALDTFIEATAAGKGHILLLQGEAGIGKSRLVEEARQRAIKAGLQTWQGNCYEYARAVPYAPLIELLRSLTAGQPAGAFESQLNGLTRIIARLLPELSTNNPASPPPSGSGAEQEKHFLFTALAQFFNRLANGRPVLLVCEDLHWCDDTSLEFLLYLVRSGTRWPVFFLLTYRGDEADASLRHFLAGLDRTRLAIEMTLTPFSPVETGRMIQAIFDLPRPVRNEFLNPIFDQTEGNPFFIEEALRSLIATGDIFLDNDNWDRKPAGDLQIPRTIQDAVQLRTSQLSLPARNLLHLAAIIGRRFNFSLLLGLSGQAEQALLGQLKELIAAQLLQEESSEQFAFRHILTQQAVYTGLLSRERLTLHLKIAQSLEELYADRLEEYLPELAYHFFKAGAWQKAFTYSLRIGERGQALNTPGAVIENFSRALEAAGHLKLAVSGRLYRGRGQAYEMKGAFKAAEADFTRAFELARQQLDKQAEWQALLDLGFLWTGRDYGQAGPFFLQAYELALQLNDAQLQAHSLNRVGNWRLNTGQLAESLRDHHQALVIFEAAGDRTGMAATHDLLAMAYSMQMDYPNFHFHVLRAIDLFRELGDKRSLASSLTSCALSWVPLSEFVYDENIFKVGYQASLAYLEEALELTTEIEWLGEQSHIQSLMSLRFIYYGEMQHGLSFAQEALRIALEIEHRLWTATAYLSLGGVYYYLGLYDAARSELEKGLTLAIEAGSDYFKYAISSFIARSLIRQGELDQAQIALLNCKRREQLENGLIQPWLALAWAELDLARNLPDAALQIINQVTTMYSRLSMEQPTPEFLKIKAEVLAGLGQWEQALSYFAEAQRLAELGRLLPILWEIHRSKARLYYKLKKAEAARQELEAARRIIVQLAAGLTDPDLRNNFLAAALTAFPDEKSLTLRQASKQSYDGLTARERQVAAYIGAGKSNREIAGSLYLSERTVEAHVGNILSKLNFNSRAQVAVWATEKGLVLQ